ncbi:MAG: hypothetical protein IT426_07740 [Pirellulales bacterium]|nr:hypothetical protein [Pirellulales bacterium]
MIRAALIFAVVSCLIPSLPSTKVLGADTGASSLERQFRELPMAARRLTGPLFWLHGDESKERLEAYVEKVSQGGNGTFTAESRPHNDWLGEGWFRDLAICLNAAKKHNLTMWIFDEKWWPSQGVAGKVPPRYASKRLEASAVEIEGPQTYRAEGYGGERHVAAIAGRVAPDGKIDGGSLVDLAPQIAGGKLSWQAPAGKWMIMKFTHVQAPPLGQNGQLSVDGASKDCVDWFIQTVYQPHYDRFSTDFGKTIPGFFYDEPETRGDWGTELNAILAENQVDWKKAYVTYKFELSGEEQAAAKYQYLDAFAEAWGRTMYGGITQWCHDHKVKSIGHFMEHGGLYHRREFCAGDMMRLQAHSDMGGIDAVFSQFVIGQKEPRYDPPVWQTPKLGSSISHVYGKADDVAMVEIFGARGQDLAYSEMKWWTDHMQVSGINFMIPHSFNPRAPYDTDCPPYFYMDRFEPRWPLYRVYADYTSRLSLMLTGGRHVCPVALLFMGQSLQVGRAVTPEAMTTALQDAQLDCDWLPYEVFEKNSRVAGKEIQLHAERYRVLVVPPVEIIPYSTLAKAKQFFDAGGVVVGYGFLPTKSATLGRNSREIAALRDAIWGESAKPGLNCRRTTPAGGRSYFLEEKPTPEHLQHVLANAGVKSALKLLAGKTDGWLHVLHRAKDDRDIFFLCNQNDKGPAREFKFRATAAGEPECWDALRNEITAIPFRRIGEKSVEFSLTLEPLETALVVFSPNRRELPLRIAPGVKPLREPIIITRDPNPAPAQPPAEKLPPPAQQILAGCKWVWFPEGNPAAATPAATRYFRQTIIVPAGKKVKTAAFTLTADNDLALYVNGQEALKSDGESENWRLLKTADIARLLQEGPNVLAVAATNAGGNPNPAGLVGRYAIEFDDGASLSGGIDETWKTADRDAPGWNAPRFDDAKWTNAREVADFGGGPWGAIDGRRRMTVSPLAAADPFRGRFAVPDDALEAGHRVFLEMDDLPDDAAAVTVNGEYAGGVIGKPARLDITARVKAGDNAILVEPLAPKSVRLVIYP